MQHNWSRTSAVLIAVPDYVEPEDLCENSEDERPSKELMRIKGWLQRLVSAMELPANPLDQVGDVPVQCMKMNGLPLGSSNS